MALQKLSRVETLIPDNIQQNIPVTLVYDNIDRLEETLSGSGTSHRVNGIIVQQAFMGPIKHRPKAEVPRTKQRSTDAPSQELPVCNVGKKN